MLSPSAGRAGCYVTSVRALPEAGVWRGQLSAFLSPSPALMSKPPAPTALR